MRERRVVPSLGADTALVPAATETAQQLKRTAGVPFHAKGRGPLRKMDTTSKPRGAAVAGAQEGFTKPIGVPAGLGDPGRLSAGAGQ